jgi:hypothetical protein
MVTRKQPHTAKTSGSIIREHSARFRNVSVDRCPIWPPRLDVLAEPECWRLLDDHGVGRIAFLPEPSGSPHLLPLNYAVRDHAVVMRTRLGSLLDTDGWPLR